MAEITKFTSWTTFTEDFLKWYKKKNDYDIGLLGEKRLSEALFNNLEPYDKTKIFNDDGYYKWSYVFKIGNRYFRCFYWFDAFDIVQSEETIQEVYPTIKTITVTEWRNVNG